MTENRRNGGRWNGGMDKGMKDGMEWNEGMEWMEATRRTITTYISTSLAQSGTSNDTKKPNVLQGLC